MILTQRDKKILRYIENHKSITINQCSKIFFSKNKEAYYQARKRLSILYKNKYIKKYRYDYKSETIYYISNKHLSYHDLKVYDIYADLINLEIKIKSFHAKYKIPTPDSKMKYREADAFIEVEHLGYFYPILLEIDMHHFTTKTKLMDIYTSNYFQEKYKNLGYNIFPTILILRPYLSEQPLASELFDINIMEFNKYDLKTIF